MRRWVVSLILLGFTSRAVAILNPLRIDFTSFFPEYSAGFHLILDDDAMCGRVVERHRELQSGAEQGADTSRPGREDDDNDNDNNADPFSLSPNQLNELSIAFDLDTSTQQVVDCILEKTPELIKVRMASAQVLMGLTPALLAVVGPQAWQTGVIASIGKRRVLALLLAAGSPMLNPWLDSGSSLREWLLRRTGGGGDDSSQRFVYPAWIYRVVRDGRVGSGHGWWGSIVRASGWLILYTLALASIGNIAHLLYCLITRAALTFTLSDSWFLIMWAVIGLSIHGFGALTVWLRIKHYPVDKGFPNISNAYASRTMATAAAGSPGSRSSPARRRLRVKVLPPSIVSVLLTWFTAVYTVGHVLFGTLLFSSILFISVLDAVVVVARLLASVVFCRLGMEYEIAMELRDTQLIENLPKQVFEKQKQRKRRSQLQSSPSQSPQPGSPPLEADLSAEERMESS